MHLDVAGAVAGERAERIVDEFAQGRGVTNTRE